MVKANVFEISSFLQEDGAAVDSLLPVTCAMRLEKRLKNIEHILSVCRESDVLNQQLIRSTVKENSSQQEVINDLHGTVIEQMVYGREKDRDDICTMLREGSDPYAASSCARQPYSVIVIHGITGSGKSTLAQYVYQHEKKAGVKYFDPIIFIHVSKTFRLHDICRDMLKEITGQDRQSNSKDLQSLESLSKELKTKLQGRRFLLVLDDVNLDEWVMLHKVLDDAQPQCGSRILVTAQKVDAAIGPPLMKLWPIPELGEDEYLSLLMHHALPAGADDYEGDYEGVGRQIVKKLHRSPIAAVAVGKRLQMNNNIKFWRAAVHLDVLNETMGALRWSYQQLGGDIRRCFKYCSTFPRGYKLQRHELVRIWIAQGFVKNINCETEDLEDLGQSYFDELVSFSFLHPQGTMNDMVHKLAEWAAGSDFFRIDLTGSTKETPPEVLPPEVLHLFIETNNRADITEKILDLGNLRTLIIEEYNNSMDHKENHDLVKEEIFRSMFIKLKKLRVLIVKITHHHSLVFSVPASIDQMKHLRYISFNCSGDNLEMIFPNQFSKLYHMQIIDAYNPRFPHPEDMANLIHLRQIPGHVQFPNVGRLTSLQMMPLFVVRKEQGYELKQLKRLNKLGGHLTIEGLGNVGSKVEALEADLSRKEGLNKLKLNFSSNTICNPVIEAEVLEGLRPPNNLTELTIKGYKGFRYPNWMLNPQHLVTSKNFKLVLNQCTQLAYIPDENELFSGLRSLCIHDCDWDSLPVDMVHLKSLKFLDITRCHKIEVIPSLPLSLVYISIDSCKVLSRTCKDKEHPNWEKVQRIHTKRIP